MPAVKEQVLSRVPVIGSKLAGYAAAAHTQQSEPTGRKAAGLDIIDIRRDKVEINLKDELAALFNPTDGTGSRALPTLLLYDAKGLQLFEDVRILCMPMLSLSLPCPWPIPPTLGKVRALSKKLSIPSPSLEQSAKKNKKKT